MQGQGFVLVDKDCECIVSTQSVRIALIFHNGFFEVRFLVMEHVFYFFFRQFPMWFARIALVFHNGFCRVRFPAMEQVFFMFLPPPCCIMQQVGVSAKKEMQQIPDFYFKKKYYNWVVLCGTLPR